MAIGTVLAAATPPRFSINERGKGDTRPHPINPVPPFPQRVTQPPQTGNTCPTKQSAASLHR
ncbi:MAG: hypothetical protein KA314_02075 [Chloroflexi bacterium]|nr:hypothetical protein [Chloroflexota bacterium]